MRFSRMWTGAFVDKETAADVQTYSRMEYLKRHQRKRMSRLLLYVSVLILQTRTIDRSNVKTAPNRLLEGMLSSFSTKLTCQ
jgi:hypothetical protein